MLYDITNSIDCLQALSSLCLTCSVLMDTFTLGLYVHISTWHLSPAMLPSWSQQHPRSRAAR